MTSLTLITPCLPHISKYIPECAERVRGFMECSAHDVNWIVVQDGPGELTRFQPPPRTRVISTTAHRGVPTCRNIALGHADSKWIMPLDSDDIITGDGVDEILSYAEQSGVAWASGNIELLDGRKAPHHSAVPASFEVRQLEEEWQAPFRFFPNAVVAKRDAVLAAGGWPALPAADDLGMILGLNGLFRGEFLPLTLFKYRYSSRQVTRALGHLDAKVESFSWLADAINARRMLEGRPRIAPPDLRQLSTTGGLPTYWPSMLEDPAESQP